jgi:CBS-domain-containing membrane protein
MTWHDFLDVIGFSRRPSSWRERLLSTAGGFLGIFAIFLTSRWLLDPADAVLIIPSLGASAVLLFAAPHVPFSQPWNLVGGHLISAGVGVACARWIPDLAVAASAAVGLAIGLMVLARCIHPPGGATALAAVIGSAKLHALGFSYVLAPVALNVATILAVAVAFNAPFPWRRYPASWQPRRGRPEPRAGYAPIRHEDFVYALSQLDTFVDVSEEDVLRIYELATRRRVRGD